MKEGMGFKDTATKSVGKGLGGGIGLNGWINIKHIRDGELINEINTPNTIVNVGLDSASGLLTGDVTNFFDYLAIGEGTTAPAATNTTLADEFTAGDDSGAVRAASTNSQVTTSVANDTAQFVHQWTFTASLAVTESGIFDASSSGTLLARQTFSAINVASGDSLQITWKVQCS